MRRVSISARQEVVSPKSRISASGKARRQLRKAAICTFSVSGQLGFGLVTTSRAFGSGALFKFFGVIKGLEIFRKKIRHKACGAGVVKAPETALGLADRRVKDGGGHHA